MEREEARSRHSGRHRNETREERKRRRQEKRQRREERHQPSEVGDEQQNRSSPPSKRTRLDLFQQETPSDGTFVWKKKIEQQRRRGEFTSVEHEERCRKELAEELEAAKRRRGERDLERAAWEEDRARLEREREQEENADWHRSEASFHGVQHFLRQGIRIREGRPVGTDVLAWNVRLDLFDVEKCGGGVVEKVRGMDTGELEEVAENVEKELDYIPDYSTEGDIEFYNRKFRIEWWQCVKKCVEGQLQILREGEFDGAGGVHGSVRGDMENLLEGKSFEKLVELEREISVRLQPGADGQGKGVVDGEFGEVDFWVAVLTRIRHLLAEQRLRDMDDVLSKERIRRIATIPKDDAVVNRRDGNEKQDEFSSELEMVKKEEEKGMGDAEEKFADEVDISSEKRQVLPAGYAWNDKYRPRKPRYFNRVHTGYDWTKYNRTHYDHDNPPPKTVQGYRFNIFYPDLIDFSKTPTYKLSTTDNPEVSIIAFTAGPPYEDVAFKIVNRPWERSHRRGYRCSFDKGVLQVWFNFQRYRYRR